MYVIFFNQGLKNKFDEATVEINIPRIDDTWKSGVIL